MTHSFLYKSKLNSEGLAKKKRKKELNNEFLIPDLPDWCLINHTKNKNYNIAFKVFC